MILPSQVKKTLELARDLKMTVKMYVQMGQHKQTFQFKGDELDKVDCFTDTIRIIMQNKGVLLLDDHKIVAVEVQPGFAKGNF